MKTRFFIILLLFACQFNVFAQKNLTADEIIHKYLLLVGNLKNVPSFSYQLSSGTEGRQGNRIKFKNPSKLYLAYTYEMEDVVRICYNGKTFGEYYPITKKSKPLSAEKFCREILSNMIFPELLVNSMKIKTILEGTEMIDGRKAQKIKFEMPQGGKWTEFFDMDSGLKVRTSYEIKTDDGDMMKTTLDFQEYQDLGVFHLPQKMTLTMGVLDMTYQILNFKANETMDDAIFETEK